MLGLLDDPRLTAKRRKASRKQAIDSGLLADLALCLRKYMYHSSPELLYKLYPVPSLLYKLVSTVAILSEEADDKVQARGAPVLQPLAAYIRFITEPALSAVAALTRHHAENTAAALRGGVKSEWLAADSTVPQPRISLGKAMPL